MTDVDAPAESELDRLVQRAIERLAHAHFTFTEDEALHEVWEAGYEVTADSDPRFVLAQEAHGSSPRQWQLVTQSLANNRLLDRLQSGAWDGRDVEADLDRLDTEDDVHYVFCPTDDRFRRRPDGSWEPTEERDLALKPVVKAELDALEALLLEAWKDDGSSPWTVHWVGNVLRDLGWRRANESQSWLTVRSWLRHSPSIIRVGVDYWVPKGAVPDPPTRQVLRVLPICPTSRTKPEPADGLTRDASPLSPTSPPEEEWLIPAHTPSEPAGKSWTVVLRTVNLVEGFLHVPAAARSPYPPRASGSADTEVLRGTWFDTGDALWLWLDREHDRVYGPDLADKLAWCSAGDRIRVEWTADVILFRSAGVDAAVHAEETRLVDPEALRELRGGLGETYLQSLRSILEASPDGMTFPELVHALRARQEHVVHQQTLRSLLTVGNFAQRDGRWFEIAGGDEGARQLRRSIALTYLPDETPTDEPTAVVRGIRARLQEIVARLRSARSSEPDPW